MAKNLKLEICCYSIQSVMNAAAAKADRIELCADIASGGSTPGIGLIERAVQVGIDVYVIVRPRGGDFFYSDDEFNIMKSDIISCKNLGAKGIVVGLLNKDGNVDKGRTRILAELSNPMDVTFHRAIDMSSDLFKAIDDIYDCGINRILTSGGYSTALEGIEVIKQMVTYSENRLSVMVGSGVNANNIKQFYGAGVKEFHSSATSYIPSQMEYRNPKLNMGNKAGYDEYLVQIADLEKIREMKLVIENL